MYNAYIILFILFSSLYMYNMDYTYWIYLYWIILIRYIICECLLPFNRLPFCFICGFLHFADVFQFDIFPFLYLCFSCHCLRSHLQKTMPKTSVTELTTYVFFQEFMISGFRCLIILSLFLYMGKTVVHFILLHVNCLVFLTPFN